MKVHACMAIGVDRPTCGNQDRDGEVPEEAHELDQGIAKYIMGLHGVMAWVASIWRPCRA